MKTRRLRALAHLLETLDPKSFNMCLYGNGLNPHEEGFKGCAAGHATKLFANKGFRLSKKAGIVVAYENHTGLQACKNFFDLPICEAACVFMLYTESPNQVAQRIQSLLKNPQPRLNRTCNNTPTPEFR